ncbi:MAG: 2-dehydropantoate 2-reductase [Dehalococcoidia bacterium]|jgi:2-dehydropantoate 2-reductase
MSAKSSGIKRICVFGVGGVGGYFGGRLAHNMHGGKGRGYEIYFIARGPHLNAVRIHGLKVITPTKTFIARPTLAVDDIRRIPTPDLVLLCVKSYDLDTAVRKIKSNMNDNTVIIPLLNGVDIYDRIRAQIENGIVLPACAFVGTHIQSPGVIKQNGGGTLTFGKDPRHPDFAARNVIELFKRMDVNFTWNDDPFSAIWEKYIFIAAFGLVSVHTGKTLGEIMEDAESRENVRSIMMEVAALARAKGISLPANVVEESLAKANKVPHDTKSSYQRDVESGKRSNEGDLYGGAIIRMGEELGVATPVTASIYSEIQKQK